MTTKNYGMLETAKKVEILVDRLIKAGKPIGFDCETGYDGKDQEKLALKPFHPDFKVAGFSFTNATTWARYVPLAHDGAENVETIPAVRALWKLVQSKLSVIHNAPYELQAVSRLFRDVLWDDEIYGEAVRASDGYFPFRSDTLMEAFMLQVYEPRSVGLGLKGLTKHVFGHAQADIYSLYPGLPVTKKKYIRFNSLALTPEVIAYACEDVVWCLGLHEIQYPQVKDMLMFKTELLLMPVIARMEKEGLVLNWDAYSKIQQEVGAFKDKMNEQIQNELSKRTGTVVNINLGSPKQVAGLLYGTLNLPIKEFTETGQPGTGEKALRAIATKDPAVQQILQWREIGKLKGTYIDKYLNELRYADDDRAHPNHRQSGAATGRLSVDGVSYQQWPKPYHYKLDDGTKFDLNYRDFLISPPGYRQMGFDFSQVELRILAGMANETTMLKAFADGVDIHTATASSMFNIPVSEVTKELRAKGKTGNFAVVFQSGAQNMAELMGTTKEEAQELLRRYYDGFPNLRTWMDTQIYTGKRDGYVTTKFGRKFTIWEYQEQDTWMHAKGDRMTINAPIQGGAADYLKIGMVRADKAIHKAGMQDKIRMIMTIHDALEFYVHDSVSSQEVIDIVQPAVSFPIHGFPEIRADWHEGLKWGSVIEIKLDKNKKIDYYEVGDSKLPTFEEALAEQHAMEQALIQEETSEASQEVVEPETDITEEPPWLHASSTSQATITLTLKEMPNPEPWEQFKLYLAEHKGEDKVVIHTPEGVLLLMTTHTLTPEDASVLSHMLGGVTMTREHVGI